MNTTQNKHNRTTQTTITTQTRTRALKEQHNIKQQNQHENKTTQ